MSSPYPGDPGPQQQPGGSTPGDGASANAPSASAHPPYGPDGGSAAFAERAPAGSAGGAPPERKKPWPWIVGICGCLVLALVLAGGVGLALFLVSGGEDDPETGAGTSSETDEATEDATTEEPTSEEPTTDEPTTDKPTLEVPDEKDPGLPGLPAYGSTPVQDPDEDDLDAATEVLLDHLNGLSDGDPDMACATRLDPVTGEGINEDSFLYDECIKSVEEQLDENEWEGVASALTPDDFTAELDAENRVVLVNLAGEEDTLAQIAKGSDGNMYLAAF